MQLLHIKSDVYHLIGGDFINCFLTEKELLNLIKNNDIADVVKTPLGYYVIHDVGNIPFRHYLKIISQNALDSICIILNNNLYEHS